MLTLRQAFKKHWTVQKEEPSGDTLISHWSAGGPQKASMDTGCTFLSASKWGMLISLGTAESLSRRLIHRFSVGALPLIIKQWFNLDV